MAGSWPINRLTASRRTFSFFSVSVENSNEPCNRKMKWINSVLDTIGKPAVYNLLGKVEQVLPVFFDHLVDLPPGIKIHILHLPVVEPGPAVTGDKDEDEDEEDEEGDGGGQGPSSPIQCTCINEHNIELFFND